MKGSAPEQRRRCDTPLLESRVRDGSHWESSQPTRRIVVGHELENLHPRIVIVDDLTLRVLSDELFVGGLAEHFFLRAILLPRPLGFFFASSGCFVVDT